VALGAESLEAIQVVGVQNPLGNDVVDLGSLATGLALEIVPDRAAFLALPP